MQFLKSSVWASTVVIVKTLTSIIINKEIARNYLPDQFALFAHFQNFLGIFLTVPSDGINMGVIKYLADKNAEQGTYRKIFISGLVLNLMIFVAAVLAIIIFQDYFTTLFAREISTAIWMIGIFIALFIQLINLFFLSVLLARQQLRQYVLINIVSSVIGVILVVVVVNYYNFSYALLAAAIGPASMFFVAILLTLKRKHLKEKLSAFKFDIFTYKQLGEFILMAASVMVFGRIVDFFIRQYAMSEFSTYQTGLWQSVVKFSDYYTAAFTTILGMVYYPKISQLVNEPSELKIYIRSVLKIAVPFIAVGLLIVYFGREFILVLFFDEQFKAAAFLFDFQLMGDFLRLISLLLSFLISAQARTGLFISMQGGSSLLYIALVFLCTNEWGMEGFPIAHAIRFSLYLLMVGFIYRKLLFS
jgi:polysaccharide transporter, PST family